MKYGVRIFAVALAFLVGAVVLFKAPPDREPRVCVDRYLDPETPEAAQAIVSARGKLWEPGAVIRVRFLEGGPRARALVEEYARKWENVANVRLVFDQSPDAPVRIRFRQGSGSWSFIGTDCLFVPPERETMNFGWLDEKTEESEFYVATHEFGHALGFQHEHQSPNSTIPWNAPAVYSWYRRTQGWPDAKIYQNVLMKFSRTTVDAGPFDPSSIMEYPVDRALTRGGFEIGWNTKLSPGDASMARRLYPRKQVAVPSNCPNRGALGPVIPHRSDP